MSLLHGISNGCANTSNPSTDRANCSNTSESGDTAQARTDRGLDGTQTRLGMDVMQLLLLECLSLFRRKLLLDEKLSLSRHQELLFLLSALQGILLVGGERSSEARKAVCKGGLNRPRRLAHRI